MSVFISIPKKGNAKESSNYCTIALIAHARKVMLTILQVRLPQLIVIHTVKDFGVVNKAEVYVFLELSCFSYDPTFDLWFLCLF